jgi:hypothetical protein
MAGSIADFKSSFRKDLARVNRFDVFIPIPFGLFPFIGETRSLALRCENAQLPGRNLSTASAKIYGVTEEYPYASTFDDVSLTFIVTEDMRQKNLFDSWLNYINPTSTYNVKYKKQYAVPILINQYDLQNKLSLSVSLLDAYPKAVNQMDLDWASDNMHKVTVTFAYTSWRNNSVDSLATDFIDAARFNDELSRRSPAQQGGFNPDAINGLF